MTMPGRVLFAALWVVLLLVVSSVVSAQMRRDPAAVISGADLGFRPEGWNGSARTGTWVVRIDGRWVEAQGVVKPMPATTR